MDSRTITFTRTEPQELPALRLIIEPEPVADLSPNRPARFAAQLEGGDVVILSHQPLVDGARCLLARGFPADQQLTLRHAGAVYDAFQPTPLGGLARWSYAEGERTPLQRQRWKPRQMPVAVCPEDQKSSSAAEPALQPVRRGIASTIAGTAGARGRP